MNFLGIDPVPAILLWIIGKTVGSAAHIKRRVGMLGRIALLLHDRIPIAIGYDSPPIAIITGVPEVVERLGIASARPITSRAAIPTRSHLTRILNIGIVDPIDRDAADFK
jgi:hypothetical protein